MSSVRRSGPASIATPRIFKKSLAALAAVTAAIAPWSCATPTQVTVIVRTDLPCSRLLGVAVSVGTVDTVEGNPTSSESNQAACSDTEEGADIGTVVLVPTEDKNAKFAVKVVAGIDTSVEQCGAMTNGFSYRGCIVARRSLNFIPKTAIVVPIFLDSSCEGVACAGTCEDVACAGTVDNVLLTCVLGECVRAEIEDPGVCEEAKDCGEDVLTDPAKPPVPVAVKCSSPSTIQDEFKQDGMSVQWINRTLPEEILVEPLRDGTLVIAPPLNVAKPTAVEIRSEHWVTLLQDAITVQVPEMVDTSSQVRAYLAAEDEGSSIRIEQQGGKLRFLSPDQAGEPTATEIDYDIEKHAWWEIRSTTSQILMRTSPNGVDWKVEAQVTRPAFADLVQIVLGVAADGAVTKPEKVRFDNLNQGRLAGEWCSMDTFPELFTMETTPSEWVAEQRGLNKGDMIDCDVKNDGMNIALSSNGQMFSRCAYRTKKAFDMRGRSVVMEFDSLTGLDEQIDFHLTVVDDAESGMTLGVRYEGPDPSFYRILRTLGGSKKEEVALYESERTRFRIREEKGIIYWDTATPMGEFKELFNSSNDMINLKGVKMNAMHVGVVLVTNNAKVSPSLTSVNVKSVSAPPPPTMP